MAIKRTPTPPMSDSNWLEYKQFILNEMKDLKEDIQEMRKEMRDMHTEIVRLKTQAGMWGAAIATAVSVFVGWIQGMMK